MSCAYRGSLDTPMVSEEGQGRAGEYAASLWPVLYVDSTDKSEQKAR